MIQLLKPHFRATAASTPDAVMIIVASLHCVAFVIIRYHYVKRLARPEKDLCLLVGTVGTIPVLLVGIIVILSSSPVRQDVCLLLHVVNIATRVVVMLVPYY